jgi:hypothetical protein
MVNGLLRRKTPAEARVYTFDWSSRLPPSALILTSVMSADVLRPTTAPALTLDYATNGARTTQLRVAGGSKGAHYKIQNEIMTNEGPDQVMAAWFFLQII